MQTWELILNSKGVLMQVLQLQKTIIPPQFVINTSTTYIANTLSDDVFLYDVIEMVLEYDNSGIGLVLFDNKRDKTDIDTNGYINLGVMDRGNISYSMRIKNKAYIIQGAVNWGSIKRVWLNLYNYQTISQTVTETRVITESSQLATIWEQNLIIQQSILQELKNISVNQEVTGRFIAQSSRMWNNDSILVQDEWNQAKLEVQEGY